jgi:hypothetical protein
MKSVEKGNMEMFKLLIDNGALSSINTPDNVNIWLHEIIYTFIYIVVIVDIVRMI